MQAAVMTEPFHIELRNVAVPKPKSNEVLVQVKSVGICGSDVHFYDGSNPYARYPQIFGHELSGVIEEVGSSVEQRLKGERVIVEPAVPCGKCYACRIGKPNACADIDMIGSVRAGGFAEYLTVPEKHVHVMPDNMSHDVGALCEPFTIGAQAIYRADIRAKGTVVVIGMGPIGLTVLSQLKRQHEVKVFAVDVITERLELARKFGADVVVDASQYDTFDFIAQETHGEGANIVIECAGLTNTIEQTIHLVSAGGRIVIVGLTGKDVTFPGQLLTKKDVELYGTRHSVNMFPQVIQFLNENPDVAETFISHRMAFTDIEEALHSAKNQPRNVTKVVLKL